MIDFPASPTIGQTFTAAGVTWTWDGAKWLPNGLVPSLTPGINDNKLINGDMRIDQRNSGATGTATGVMTVDRWSIVANLSKGTWGRNLNNVVQPVGFPYYLGYQSSSAYTAAATDFFGFTQPIEADMIGDLWLGSASGSTMTLSFLAYSSLTGTFGGSFENYAGTRSYPFTYTIPTANTWTKIVVSIPRDTVGPWVISGNVGAAYLFFDLGSGSTYRGTPNTWIAGNYIGATGAQSIVAVNGATFYITGVKLEAGSVATPFNRQSVTKSLSDCRRYYQRWNDAPGFGALAFGGYHTGGQYMYTTMMFVPAMRAAPTILTGGGTPFIINVVSATFIPTADIVSLQLQVQVTGAAVWRLNGGYIEFKAEL